MVPWGLLNLLWRVLLALRSPDLVALSQERLLFGRLPAGSGNNVPDLMVPDMNNIHASATAVRVTDFILMGAS